MRHRKRTAKLGRTSEHRNRMLANLVCSLIKHRRVTTTLAKARAARSVAEKLVTLGKDGTIHNRRLAVARLHQEDAVRILFNEIAPSQKDRPGGYTRIIKLNQRQGDAAPLAILEWVDEALLEKVKSAQKTKEAEAAPTTAETKKETQPETAPATPAPEKAEPADAPEKETPKSPEKS
jgi:large subunit ribosomal protein L17